MSTPFLLKILALATLTLPTTNAYAGQPDGIMRGNRHVSVSNSKYNSSPSDFKTSNRSANPVYAATNPVRPSHVQTKSHSSYFEELWGNVAGMKQVPYCELSDKLDYEQGLTFTCLQNDLRLRGEILPAAANIQTSLLSMKSGVDLSKLDEFESEE